MNSETISINQTLHGYIDGHTLIASSLELPAEVKRIMLLLSDMSGSRMEKGFEEYITGYPIKEIHKYAIAKTWYAPEMKRPGCVWTHTILIDFADVPKVSNPELLLSIFLRPEFPQLIKDGYLKTLSFNDNNDYLFKSNISYYDRYEISVMLKNLYDDSDKSLLLRSETSKSFAELFLMIWGQQWPRLKRNFSFCSGAIFPRKLRGEILDLQIVPAGSDTFSSIANEVNVVNLDDSTEQILEAWLEFTVLDLFDPSPTVKSFLNYFGSDVSIKRSAFKSLVETYVFFINEKPDLDRCINFLANHYPSQNEANNLKTTLLSQAKSYFDHLLPKYNENALLYHLTITKYYESLDYGKINYDERFIDFFNDYSEQAVNLLRSIIKQGPNLKGEAVITQLAQISEEKKYLDLIWLDKQLASIFIGLNPRLTLSKRFWLANSGNHVEIISQLQKADIGNEGWRKIIHILIDINSPVDLHVLQTGDISIEILFLEYFNEHEEAVVGTNWLTYLKSHSSGVLEWFRIEQGVRPETVELIISTLNPNSHLVVNSGIGQWANYLSKIDRNKKHLVKIDVHAFCLALAFNVNDIAVQEIFESSFELIFFALASDQLDFNLWKNIEIHTKPLSFWRDWDKCKKLVNATVDLYIKNNWSIKQLVQQIHSEDLKDRILIKYKKRK